MVVGIKVRYDGKPLWQVGYMIERVSEQLKDFWVNGNQVIERAVGYMLIPAESMLEARVRAVEKAMACPKRGYVNLGAMGYNTHVWTGEPNSAEAAKKSYERYLQNKEVH